MNVPFHRAPACRWLVTVGVVTILCIFAALCVGSYWNNSPTFDETYFIGDGYAFLKGDPFSQPKGNLVLSEKWMALHLLAMKVAEPTAQERKIAQQFRENAYWYS